MQIDKIQADKIQTAKFVCKINSTLYLYTNLDLAYEDIIDEPSDD